MFLHSLDICYPAVIFFNYTVCGFCKSIVFVHVVVLFHQQWRNINIQKKQCIPSSSPMHKSFPWSLNCLNRPVNSVYCWRRNSSQMRTFHTQFKHAKDQSLLLSWSLIMTLFHPVTFILKSIYAFYYLPTCIENTRDVIISADFLKLSKLYYILYWRSYKTERCNELREDWSLYSLYKFI